MSELDSISFAGEGLMKTLYLSKALEILYCPLERNVLLPLPEFKRFQVFCILCQGVPQCAVH